MQLTLYNEEHHGIFRNQWHDLEVWTNCKVLTVLQLAQVTIAVYNYSPCWVNGYAGYSYLPQWAHCLAFGCGVPSLPGTHPQCPLSCNTQWHWWMNRTPHIGSLYHCVQLMEDWISLDIYIAYTFHYSWSCSDWDLSVPITFMNSNLILFYLAYATETIQHK